MSSGSEAENEVSAGVKSQDRKRRRTSQACDMCKQRKSRCERSPKGGKCTHCAEYNLDCSYVNAQKKYPSGYVVALETKVKQLEALVAELRPGEDFSHRVGKPITRRNWMQLGVAGNIDTASSSDSSPPDLRLPTVDPSSMDPNVQEETFDAELDIISKLKDLVIEHKRIHLANFYGSSSSQHLIANALELQNTSGQAPSINIRVQFLRSLRTDFWCERPWERVYERKRTPVYTFPDHDLLARLVGLYFDNMNVYLPILHRLIFEDQLRQSLHLRDAEFGAVVLLVCAIGARLSDDPRVLTEGTDDWHSAGFKWFSQIIRFGDTLAPSFNVHQLQAVTLACIYLKGRSEVPAWTLAGLGIRLAQNIGLHRRSVYGETPTVSDELFKRCFWSLVLHDRWLSANMGRSTAISEEDFDVELPIDCDDEYWMPEDPELAFKQPEGKPSRVSAFIWIIKLSHIVSSSLRTIHAGKKAKLFHGFVGAAWEEKAIAYHDAALDRWAESLPEHLMWDPEASDRLRLLQSAFVNSQYHELRIIIHRPFISIRRANTLPYPSLAICLNAARNCARIFDVAHKRYPMGLPLSWTCAFAAGVILLYQVVLARRSRAGVSEEDLEDARRCLKFLTDMEARSLSAGRVRDILGLMSCLGTGAASGLRHHDTPSNNTTSRKRARETDHNPLEAPDASAHTQVDSAYINRSRHTVRESPAQDTSDAHHTYHLLNNDVAAATAYATVPAFNQTDWSHPPFPSALVDQVDFAPDLEPFGDGATLAALFGYPAPASDLSNERTPSIDPWAFALGSAGLPVQPSLSDTQADIMNLFGNNGIIDPHTSSDVGTADWDWQSLLDGTTSIPNYDSASRPSF